MSAASVPLVRIRDGALYALEYDLANEGHRVSKAFSLAEAFVNERARRRKETEAHVAKRRAVRSAR